MLIFHGNKALFKLFIEQRERERGSEREGGKEGGREREGERKLVEC